MFHAQQLRGMMTEGNARVRPGLQRRLDMMSRQVLFG
jgi:hypothetical protein